MRTFDEIYEIVVERKGDVEALLDTRSSAKSVAELTAIPDDRWLSAMTRCVFQAGFNWKVVDHMWPGFEAAFEGFDIGHCMMLNDEELGRLVSDKRIVRHGQKIRSVQDNAAFVHQLATEHGSAGAFFATWPGDDFANLLTLLKKRGSRLGGNSGPYFLRSMGVDGYILSRDVTARLIAEGVVDKTPTSQKDLAAVQTAFNTWQEQSGRSLTKISQVLALSVG